MIVGYLCVTLRCDIINIQIILFAEHDVALTFFRRF